MFNIEMLPANEGDALWIEYGPDHGPVHRVLIDCGRKKAYRAVRERLDTAAAQGKELDFDLFVLTHVDADHIEGAVPLLGDPRFKPERVADLWFNEWRHLNGERVPPSDALGARQGEYFAGLIRDRGFSWNAKFDHYPVVVPAAGPLPTVTLDGGMQLTLLSPDGTRMEDMRAKWEAQLRDKPPGHPDHIEPGDWEKALEVLDTKALLQPDALGATDWTESWDPDEFDSYSAAGFNEDDKEPNGSSIALLAEYDGKTALLTGDAFPSVLAESLNRLLEDRGMSGQRLELDAVKMPHHGSQNNISPELIQMVRCRRWLFSTDGARHHHPHPNAVARVIAGAGGRPTLYFNYRSDESKVWDDANLRDDQGYDTEYGSSDGGLVVRL